MSLEERSAQRRKRIQSHKSHSFAEAELWDLEYWQGMSPQDRLSALVALHEDVKKAQAARRKKRNK